MAKIMKLTAVVSVIITLITSAVYLKTDIGVFLSAAITFGTVAYHFAMRLIVGTVLNKIMKNRADYNSRWYQPLSFEKKLYKRLNVKKWKDILPTYNPEQFSVHNKTYDEIAQVMCQAEIVHEVIFVLSFLPLLAAIKFGAFAVFLFTSVLAACFDLMFVIMQRYNRPRVIKLANKVTSVSNDKD